MAHNAGQRTSAQTQLRPTEPAIVIPNCVKNEPDVPGMNATGTNTAMNTSVHEITATDTSLMAWRVASRALLMPPSIFAITASTTTMASSTTVPIASTRANSVNIFSEKPASCTIANVPSSDTIIEIDGISVAFQFCKKKYTTRMTSRIAITRVSTTLWMAAKRKSLLVSKVTNSNPAGRLGFSCSYNSSICWFTSVALAPGDWFIK